MLDASGIAWQRRTLLESSRHRVPACGWRAVRPEALAEDDCPKLEASGGRHPEDACYFSCPRVLLVDVVGELGAWWGTAQIAFVGGSLGNRGGQNMIEPAAYGAAVSFGPETRNFRDIVAALVVRDAAVVVADGEQLFQFVCDCLRNPAAAEARGRRAAQLVQEQLGATQRTLLLLRPLVHGSPEESSQGHRDAA
jgi:3-deoxy-D-manno-octulosonic-acid transferase